MDEFNLELVRGDKARGSDVPTNAKEWTAFLVDCGDAMYRTYRGPVGSLQGLTLFQAALKQISGIVASRLAHGVEDDITIVGWNRGAPDVWHAGGPPTPALLERLDDMVSSNAKDIVFGKNDAREGRATSLAESLRDAMVSAVLEFDTDEWNNYKIDVSLVVAVWTADNTGACPQGDDSGGGGDPAFRTITELIHRRNIKFHAVLLDDLKLDVPRQCASDASTQWARVCGSSEGSRDHNTRSIVQNPFALPLSTRLVSHTDAFKMVRLSGTSRTTTASPALPAPRIAASRASIRLRTRGWTIASRVSSAARCGSVGPKTKPASMGRRTRPSASSASAPKCLAISPRTSSSSSTSWAIRSASSTSAPRSPSNRATVDLPAAIRPTTPMTIMASPALRPGVARRHRHLEWHGQF